MWQRWTITAAWVVAGALVALGLRRLVSGRRGLFVGYLSLFVALLSSGCGASESGGHPPVASSNAEAPAPAPTPRFSAPPALAEDGRWERFVALWRELDAAEAGSTSEPIAYERITAWGERLTRILEPATLTGPWFERGELDPLSETLIRFTRFRIQNLGPSHLGMTRMMPPRSAVFRERLLDGVEARIDALVGLREAGDIDDEAFERGLAAVAGDIYLSSVIELVGAVTEPHGADGTDPQRLERDPEAWIRGFESLYERPESRAHREAVLEQLRTLEALRPQLEALIRDLEDG